MRILFIFILIFFVSLQNTNAQKQTGFNFVDGQYFLGGDLQLAYGNTQSFYEIAPEISYSYYRNIDFGVGFFYLNYTNRQFKPAYTESNFGVRLFTRVFPIESVYLHGEYERSFLKSPYLYNPNGTNVIGSDAVNVGIGFIRGDREDSYTYFAILYNTMNKEFFIGYNPFIRAGFVWAL